MQKTTMLTAAIAALVMTSGITMMPVQAFDPECTHNFTMTTIEPPLARPLAVSASEVGRIEVGATEKTVTVKLSTDEAILEFVIYFLDGSTCTLASGTDEVTCANPEVLDTTGQEPDPPQSKDCTLDPPGSGTRSYFFGFLNDGSNSLGYRPWDST